MLSLISDHPGIALGFIGILTSILVYFIKKVDSKVDTISSIKSDIVIQLQNIRVEIRNDLTQAFNSICAERQGSCAKLQDQKLQSIIGANQAICNKIAKLDLERKEDWQEQHKWNQKIENIVYKEK